MSYISTVLLIVKVAQAKGLVVVPYQNFIKAFIVNVKLGRSIRATKNRKR